jgi:hypothetical protein
MALDANSKFYERDSELIFDGETGARVFPIKIGLTGL